MSRFTIKILHNPHNKENIAEVVTTPGSQATSTTTSSQAAEITPPTKKRASWTTSDDISLITFLENCVETGNVSDNGFKKTVWEGAAEMVNKNLTTGGSKTRKSCQDRYTAVSI